jgi:hypothetical protein
MLEVAVDLTPGPSQPASSMRFADDLAILSDARRRSDWLVKAIDGRLRDGVCGRFSHDRDQSRRAVSYRIGVVSHFYCI